MPRRKGDDVGTIKSPRNIPDGAMRGESISIESHFNLHNRQASHLEQDNSLSLLYL